MCPLVHGKRGARDQPALGGNGGVKRAEEHPRSDYSITPRCLGDPRCGVQGLEPLQNDVYLAHAARQAHPLQTPRRPRRSAVRLPPTLAGGRKASWQYERAASLLGSVGERGGTVGGGRPRSRRPRRLH